MNAVMEAVDPVAERIVCGIQRIARDGCCRNGDRFERPESDGKDRAIGPCCIIGSLCCGFYDDGIPRLDDGHGQTAKRLVQDAADRLHGTRTGSKIAIWHDDHQTTVEMVFDVPGCALAGRIGAAA